MTAPSAVRIGRPTARLIAFQSPRFDADFEPIKARNTMSASLRNSEGWAMIGPTLTQFALPPSERPRGLRTRDWKPSAPTNMTGARCISHR